MEISMEMLRKVLIGLAVVGAIVAIQWDKVKRDMELMRGNRREWLYLKWKNWGEPILVAVVLALIIRTFLVQAYKIPTGSMRPTFLENDRILVDKITYRFKDSKTGDIIVFEYPQDPKKDFVKRLIAKGGETVQIKDGHVFLNGARLDEPPGVVKNYYYNREDWDFGQEGQIITVPEDHLFVLGDNSAHSSDSRNWGFVPESAVKGKAVVIYWPPSRVGLIKDNKQE